MRCLRNHCRHYGNQRGGVRQGVWALYLFVALFIFLSFLFPFFLFLSCSFYPLLPFTVSVAVGGGDGNRRLAWRGTRFFFFPFYEFVFTEIGGVAAAWGTMIGREERC
ncbi:hypothetical protein J3F83DRAFT_202160 [Trichoderma novae-zelandiae]